MINDDQEPSHQQFAEQLPELAAGVLGGRDRVALLGHLEGCASCTDELDQLMAAADSLVHLAGEADPPIGFESRVMEQLEARPVHPRGHDRWRRRSLVVISVAALAAVAFGIGWATHSVVKQPVQPAIVSPGAYGDVSEASLISGGKPHGMVTVYSDEEGWILMTVDSSTWSGPVQCRVISKDGVTRTVGSFDLVSGRGAWVAPLPEEYDNVRTAELVGDDGRVLASAQFS
jgi:hypothetical protein